MLRSTTFPALIREAALAFGEAPAVRLGDTIISFAELERRSALLARGLAARGVGKGSRIGFVFGNGPDFVILLAAIARVGAVAIPLSTLLKSAELVRVLRHADLHGLIVQRSFLGTDYVDRLVDALPELVDAEANLRLMQLPYLRWIISTGDNLPPGIRDEAWLYEAAPSFSDAMLAAIEAEVHPSDQIFEIYTSGSMALPKGVKHLHGPALFRARYIADACGFGQGSSVDVIMPMFWIGGLVMYLFPALVCGGTAVCTERTLSSSRYAMGSVLAAEDLAAMNKRPWWALGMSETLGPYSQGNEFRASGYPVCAPLDLIAERYDVRVVGADNCPVGVGETGEIQVRGYAVTPALHKLDREENFTDDGYYRTGDLGLVEGARIHFVGRAGDMIKTGGSNVSPAEVEMELQAIDRVHSAFVVGLPDAERGERVVAALVARDGAGPLDLAGIETALQARLSSYKVPKAVVEIAREDIPMLASNKVARRELAKLIAKRL